MTAAPRPIHRRLAFWAAVATGAALRSAGLFRQVLIGDEAHAFRAALRLELPEVLVAYPFTANSPPFNAWLRWLIDLEIAPSELALRIPVWIAGLALLVLAPLWISRRLGSRVGILLAWWIALSPFLVFYARFMRPYAPYVLLSAAAAALFFEWAHRPRMTTAVAYAATAAAAAYLHLLAAPFVLAPFGWLVLERGIARQSAVARVTWAKVAGVAGLVGAFLAAFVVPAWPHLSKLTLSRRMPLETELEDIANTFILLAGSRARLLVLLFWVLVVVGAVRLGRRDGPLARLLAILLATQIVAVPVLSPTFIGNPLILARYLLPVLLPVLILVSVALGPPAQGRRRLLAHGAAAALLAAVFLTGPLADPGLYRHSLAWRPELLGVHQTEARPVRTPPSPYRALAEGPPGDVVELPLRPTSQLVNSLADYQREHGRRVLISPGDAQLSDPRLGLRSIVPDTPQALAASGASWLVLHKAWSDELGPTLGYQGPFTEAQAERSLRVFGRLDGRARKLRRDFEAAWGPPEAEDDTVAVWHLDPVRHEAP